MHRNKNCSQNYIKSARNTNTQAIQSHFFGVGCAFVKWRHLTVTDPCKYAASVKNKKNKQAFSHGYGTKGFKMRKAMGVELKRSANFFILFTYISIAATIYKNYYEPCILLVVKCRNNTIYILYSKVQFQYLNETYLTHITLSKFCEICKERKIL